MACIRSIVKQVRQLLPQPIIVRHHDTVQQSAEQAATGQEQRLLEQSVVEDRDTSQSAEQAAIGQGLKSKKQSAEQSAADGQGPVTAVLPRADQSAEPVQPVSDSEDAVLEARSDLIFRGSHVVSWQERLSKRHHCEFRFSQLISCALHCTSGEEAQKFEARGPTSLQDWEDESILPQHSLLNLLNHCCMPSVIEA